MSTRKKIWSRILLFLIITMVLNALAANFLTGPLIYDEYTKEIGQVRNYHNFLLGDSHARVMEQEDLEGISTLNFSANSESYTDVSIKFNYLLRKTRVDTIYLTVDNHTLSAYREYSNNRHRSILLTSYREYNSHYPCRYSSYLRKKYLATRFPLFETQHSQLVKKRMESILQGKSIPDYRDFDFSTLPESERQRRSKERVQTQFPRKKTSAKLESCLEEMIDLAKKEGVELIGIKFPLTKEFYLEEQRISYGADSIFRSHGLRVLDLEDLYLDQGELFRDQDHLNIEGSRALGFQLQNKMGANLWVRSHSIN